MTHRIETLHRGAVGALFDVACRAGRSERGAEELAAAHEIVFPRRGVFCRHFDSRRDAVADPNHVLFFRRGEPYSVSHPADGGDDCTVIALSRSAASEIASARDPRAGERPDAPFPAAAAPSGPRLHLAQSRLVRAARRGDDPLAIEERLLATAALAFAAAGDRDPKGARRRRRARESTRRAHRDLAFAVKALLASRFRERLSLADVAWAVHSSPFHLARVFRRETGSSIHRYLDRIRLRAALERLAHGERDLASLALDMGYATHGHFTERFRREFGLPPSAYRREALPS